MGACLSVWKLAKEEISRFVARGESSFIKWNLIKYVEYARCN